MSTTVGNIHFGKEKGVNTCTIASKAGADKVAVTIIAIGTMKEKLGTTGKVH